jgi:hypothetical protein
MAGARLGIMCEALALSIIGLIFGSFISWQLTAIVFVALLITGIAACLDVALTVWVTEKSAPFLEHASSVRIHVS